MARVSCCFFPTGFRLWERQWAANQGCWKGLCLCQLPVTALGSPAAPPVAVVPMGHHILPAGGSHLWSLFGQGSSSSLDRHECRDPLPGALALCHPAFTCPSVTLLSPVPVCHTAFPCPRVLQLMMSSGAVRPVLALHPQLQAC